MADKFIEAPITPSSLPTRAGELSYGPDLIPQPGFSDSEYNPGSFSFSSNTPSNVDPFSNIYQGFDQSFYKNAQRMDYMKSGAPTPFNAESTLFDRFATSWDFSEKGFIPWRDNDDVYNQDTNVLKELYRSSKWAAPLFGEGFISGMRTFPDLIGGLYNGDLDRIFQTDDRLAQDWMRATKMGGSTAGGVSSFLTNFEISAANMLGMVIETVVEDALIGALTVASGGSTTPLAVAEAGKTASVFSSIYKGLKNINKLTDVFKEAKNARRLWEITENGAKVFGTKAVNFFNPLQQSTKFLKDLSRGEDYLKNGQALGNAVHGFGSFYRDLREINFALTEAKLEGGFSYVERSDEMTNDFIAKNGYAPQGKDAQDIEQNARASGDFTTKMNLPVIYLSNRIGFGNLFKGATPLTKLMNEASAGNSLFKNIKFNDAAKVFEKATGFSVKRSFRHNLGVSLNYFKANYMEGIQENLQETIQGASKDYYDKQFKNPSYGGASVMLGDMAQNLKGQVSGEGFSTFLSGALMGAIPAGGMKAISGIQNLTYRFTDKEGYQEFKQKRAEQVDKYVNQLNEIYKDPTKYLDPQLMNAVRQGELSKYLGQSVANGNKKEFYDIKDQAVYEHLWTLVRSGKSDVFKDRLEEMKQLTPEEFENALGFKVEKPEEFKSYIDDQVKKLDQIQSMYDKANEKLPNPVNLNAFKKGTPEYEEAAAQFMAFENAKQQAVFANYSFMRNAERMSGLLSDMTKTKMFGKSNYLDLSVLSDPNLLNIEMQTLKKEIGSLSQGDAESVKLANDKKKKLQTLEIWKEAMESGEIKGDTTETEGEGRFPRDYPSAANPAYEAWRNAAKLAFEKLVAVEAGINKDFSYRESINEVFDLLMDYHTLGRESKGLMEVTNILADPNNFLKLYRGHFSVIQDLRRKRVEVLFGAIKDALTVNDKNSLVNKLAFNNFVEDPENPGTYFRITDFSPVEPGSEDAAKIEQIVKDHEEATSETSTSAEAATTPEELLKSVESLIQEVENFVNDPQFAPTDLLKNHWNTRKDLFANKISQLRQLLKDGIKTAEDVLRANTLINDIRGTLNEGINPNDSATTIKAEEIFNKIGDTLYGQINLNILTDYINLMDGKIKQTGRKGFLDIIVQYTDANGKPSGRYTLDGKNQEYFISGGLLNAIKTGQAPVSVRLNQEQDAYLIDNEGVTYEVSVKDPTLFFTQNPDGTLNPVENANVPDVVKSELDKFIKAQQPKPAAQAKPAAKPAAKSILKDLLKKIEDAETTDDLIALDVYQDPSKPQYKQLLSDAERESFSTALFNKLNILEGKADVEETSEVFVNAYNKAINDVKADLKKPGITEDDIKNIFNSTFIPVIELLKDKAVKAKYRNILRTQRGNIIAKYRNSKKAKDINAGKIAIDNIIKTTPLLSDIEAAVENLLMTSVDEEIKEDIINYFGEALTKKFDKEIKDLEEAAGSLENDEILKKYINSLRDYKANVEASLERFKKQAEDIKDQTAGINLAVDVDEDYKNDTHESILQVDVFAERNATPAQRAALNNLVTSGVLLPDEVDESLSIHDASELVNRGVARIFVIGMNKGVREYLKTGKTTLLEKEYTDYLERAKKTLGYTTAEILDLVKEKIATIKTIEQSASAILNELNLPATAEIGDKEFGLLREFRKAVVTVQSETDLLISLDQLQSKVEKFLSEGVAPTSLDEFLDEKTVGIIEKLLKKEKGVKYDIQPFYDDLLEVIEKIQATKDVKDAEKLVKELAKKYTYPSKAADAANMIRAFVGSVLEIQALASGQIEAGEELTDEEIVRILNGEKRTLTPTQMRQVEDYEKDLIELLKGKMSKAPSYQESMLDYTQEELSLPESAAGKGLRYLALRPKDASDVRTTEDLTAEYEVVDGKINTRKALQNILDSDFATPAEKELAKVLMQAIPADATIDVNNSMESAGEFDPETERAAINLVAVGYKEEAPSNAIETVILHELLHGQIERALQEPDGAYKKAIKSLYAAAKTNPASKTFYAMQNMPEDEQLREFVIEAFTNPAFQYLLAKIPYAKSGKSVWQKFVEALSSLLKSIGIDIEGTVLNEVIDQTADLIKFDYTEKALDRLSKVETLEEIVELEQEINQETGLLSPSIQESINSVLKNKRNSILGKQVNEQTKSMTQVKVDGKTYYFKVEGSEIQLFRKTDKKLIRVRKPEIVEAFIQARLKEVGVNELLGKENVDELKEIMGDPTVDGTYAAGNMFDVPLDEGRLANAFNASPVLKFNSIEEFNNFRREFWRRKIEGRSTSPSVFKDTYPGRGITAFVELVNLFGGLNRVKGRNITNQIFDRLIKKGALRISIKGFTHEDYTNLDENPVSYDDFVEMYQMILSGVPSDASDRDLVVRDINKVISQAFGVNAVSAETQSLIERAILSQDDSYTFDEDLEEETQVEEEETKEDDLPITSKEPVHKKGEDPSAFDASVVDPDNTITAVDTNALRSHSFDIFPKSKDETPEFKLYYHKIRQIINALSLKSLDDLSDVSITLIADDANLRWDGSAQTKGWIDSKKGVIGYLSDSEGNPYVFDTEGNIMGKLDRNNLSDKKGLDNGVNQIVYFSTFTKESNSDTAKMLTPESKEQLLAAREKAMAGKPQIAKLVRVKPGHLNKTSLTKNSAADQGSTKNDPNLAAALNQPNVTFTFNQKGNLLAVITDKDGATNQVDLYPPKTKNVVSSKDSNVSLYKYLIDVMVTLKEMNLAGKDTSKLEKEFAGFVRRMWLSGDNRMIKINLDSIELKKTKDGNFEVFQMFTVKNGQVVLNDTDIAKAKGLVENMQINISRDWWSGKVPFKFPKVDVVNGEKVVKFAEFNYKKFLFNNVGLKSNTTEIPDIENLKRYNSTIVFTNPTDLAEPAAPAVVTTEKDLLDDPNAIKKGVENAVKSSGDTSTENAAELEALKKKKKFKAPSYDQIFEKTCR